MKRYFIIFFILLFYQSVGLCAQTSVGAYSAEALKLFNQGTALHQQHKYELAEQKYNQVLIIQPNFVEAKKNLSFVLQNLANKYYREQNYAKAISYAKKSLSFQQDNVDCYNVLADSYLALNDNSNLIKVYQKLIVIQPEDTSTLQSLCAVYLKTNQVLKAIDAAKKIVVLDPDNIGMKDNISVMYLNLANENFSKQKYKQALSYANASLSYKPDNLKSYHTLAECYLSMNDYARANAVYSKILKLNPNDSIAVQNLKYANAKTADNVLNSEINELKVSHVAPTQLYDLIVINQGVDPAYKEKMESVLDLIWSESTGKRILTELVQAQVPINITNAGSGANSIRVLDSKNHYDENTGVTSSSQSLSSVAVNIPFQYIDNFNNPRLSADVRVYNLHAFIHEFGHAYIGIKNPNDFNSIEEEIGVSMIGYNIANKIITGRYLDREQTEAYSKECLISALSDEHKNLPTYGGFNQAMLNLGILMPYPEIYSDIPGMYKKLVSEGKISAVQVSE